MATRISSKGEAHPGDILLVVHDFVARSPDELSLAKGDRIELIERDDDFGDGWFLGRHMTNGKTGLFPEVYTTPAPKGTLTGANNRRASEGPAKTTLSDEGPALQPRHVSTGTMQPRPASTSSSVNSPSFTQASTQAPAAAAAAAAAANAPRQNAMLNSPVMNETLSVIDEHITDMSTPRHSVLTNGSRRDSSVYSSNRMSKMSYIAGHETDEEESRMHTEEEVMQWGPARVAEYLEDNGVESSHCDVFKEQEISGEVLLAMDQSSIFIKEFELGPVGRRLKTWHKIKALQDEVRGANPSPAQSTSDNATGDDAGNEMARSRSISTGSALPRGLSTPGRQEVPPARSNTLQSSSQPWPSTTAKVPDTNNVVSPLQSMTSMSRQENPYRPSAQTIRQMQHSRRHSSIDSRTTADTDRSAPRKQPSIDQKWQPGQAPQTNGKAISHGHAMSTESTPTYPNRDSSLFSPSSPSDVDKGYFSSNELDNRGKGKTLVKKQAASGPVSPVHSRTNSLLFSRDRRSTQSGRIASAESMRDPVSPIAESPGSNGGAFKFGSLRISSSPTLQKQMKPTDSAGPPTVTKLDHHVHTLDAIATSPNIKGPESEASSAKATPSPSSSSFAFFKGDKKSSALRAISDAVTKKEKTTSPIAIEKTSPTDKEISSPAKTGSTTPSTDARSFDLPKSETQSRTSAGSAANLMPPPPAQRKARQGTKKSTSAYTRGLERKSPAEQMVGCDYSGWMKKKSGSLMATWKPRLFVLRGRRLSYYYSDHDTEEKGLIDISFHRVLPAHEEKLTGLHAAMTGAGGGNSTPTSPSHSTTPTMAQQELKERPAPPGESDGLFIFKLVPPKSGLAKGVNFTKPTVHYFAVNSRQEGRLWMAALMKATIDRDENGQVTTSYNQKTISLAKARARRERPPALKEEERAELEGTAASSDADESRQGLGIGIATSDDTVIPPAIVTNTQQSDDGDITALPSTPGEPLNTQEREAVAALAT